MEVIVLSALKLPFAEIFGIYQTLHEQLPGFLAVAVGHELLGELYTSELILGHNLSFAPSQG